MITFTQGNLLEAQAEALVNTVNTVGVMGKGIALMFKERFPQNFQRYAVACKADQVKVGSMYVTETGELDGPKWVVNFPTKQHWRPPSKMEWVVAGLKDLRKFIINNNVKSIAIPPLGAGNGGLDWQDVRSEIISALDDLTDVQILVYAPIQEYLNVAKRHGVEKLTPARALIAELVRRYWVLGMECSLLEIQKLAWVLEYSVEQFNLKDPLDLQFIAHKYGPYANRLTHLLNNLDGSYLHCNKRISDAGPLDVIWFDEDRKSFLDAYLKSEAKSYSPALEYAINLIDGFESPFGMELLATTGWLLFKENAPATVDGIRAGIRNWPAGAGERKDKIFDDKSILIALDRLTNSARSTDSANPA